MSGSKRVFIAALAAVLGCDLAAGQTLAAPACPNAGWVVVKAEASPGTRPVKDPAGHTLFVLHDPITETADLTEIKLAGDQHDTQIRMTFTPAAARRLHNATTGASGLRIAFVTGDRVLGAVTWSGSYGMDADQGVQISLGVPAPRVEPLINAIAACVAPIPPRP